MLLFMATCQPFLKQCAGPSRGTSLLTTSERREWADEVARRLARTPCCIDHAKGETLPPGTGDFEVPNELEIGRLLDVFVRPNGHLLITGEIYHDRPEARRIARDIDEGKPWGVSLCTNIITNADETEVLAKRITHIGITRDPQWGANDPEVGGDTWMHLVATTPQTFYRELKQQYLDREPGIYVPLETRARMLEQQVEWDWAHPGGVARPTPVYLGAADASDSVPRLQTPVAPVLAYSPPLAPPPESNPMADTSAAAAAAAPPLATPATPTPNLPPASQTTVAPTPAAPTPAAPIQAAAAVAPDVRLERLKSATQDWTRRITVPTEPDRVIFDHAALLRATELIKEWGGLVNGTDPDAWPDGTLSTLSALQDYVKQAKAETHKWATGFYGAQGLDERTKDAILNPTLPQNLERAQMVYATRNQGMQNQARFETELLAKQTEIAKTREDLKRARDEVEQERAAREKDKAELSARLTQLEQMQQQPVLPPATKRARVDEPVPAAAAAMIPGAHAVDVTATRGSPAGSAPPVLTTPQLPNVRDVTSRYAGVFGALKGTFNKNEEQTMASGYLTPWRNPEDSLSKRILNLAGSY